MSVSKTWPCIEARTANYKLSAIQDWNKNEKVIVLGLWIMHVNMVSYWQCFATLCRLSVGGESLRLPCSSALAQSDLTMSDHELPHHPVTAMTWSDKSRATRRSIINIWKTLCIQKCKLRQKKPFVIVLKQIISIFVTLCGVTAKHFHYSHYNHRNIGKRIFLLPLWSILQHYFWKALYK